MLAHRLQRKLAGFVMVRGDRDDLALRKVAHRIAQHFMFVAECVGQARQSCHLRCSLLRQVAPPLDQYCSL